MKIKQLKRWFKNPLKAYSQWRHQKRVNNLTDKLYAAKLKEVQERLELKKEIHAFVSEKFKVSLKSKFIPKNIRREIVDSVYQEFRPRMTNCKLVLNYKLQFA